MVKRDQSPLPEPESCPLSLPEHVNKIFLALMLAGLGGGCEGTYQGLIEVAEFIRTVKGFASYTATRTNEMLRELAEAERQQAMADATRHMKVGQA